MSLPNSFNAYENAVVFLGQQSIPQAALLTVDSWIVISNYRSKPAWTCVEGDGPMVSAQFHRSGLCRQTAGLPSVGVSAGASEPGPNTVFRTG